MTTMIRTAPFSRANGLILSTVFMALAARKQRKSLRNLDDAALADLGLSRDEARAEANRPIWDVPANWRC